MPATQKILTHPNIIGAVAEEGASSGAVDALLVEGGDICAVGDLASLRERYPDAELVRLPGHAIVAGFHDAHIHTGGYARALATVNLRGAESLDAALQRLREFIAASDSPGTSDHPSGSDGGDETPLWITGGYWDANAWATGLPSRHDLDAVVADRPVALSSLDGHSLWVNSLGLALAGIGALTDDVPGGIIVREGDGREPAGLLRERACDPVLACFSEQSVELLPGLLAVAQERLLAMGVTHITDFDEDATRLAFEALHERGQLKLRVHKGIPAGDLDRAIAEGWRTGAGDRFITTGPVKLFSDGALGSHSAHMLEDFADAPGNHGVEVIDTEALTALVEQANAAGIAVATHAIGDAANRSVLNAYERTAQLTREHGLRNRVEHAQHIAQRDLPRFAELGVIASVQPTHCTTDFALAGRRLGDREVLNYAWRSLLDSGARVAFGSDAPIEPAEPLFGVHAAVTRQDRQGRPEGGFEPHERVSVEEALALFSEGPAYAAGLEGRVGRIAVGQYADLVALSADPRECEPAEIAGLSVVATFVDGNCVYEAEPFQRLMDAAFEGFDRATAPAMITAVFTREGVVGCRATGEPAGPGSTTERGTVFRIASMTKSFLAATALILRDEGLLDFAAPITQYVPGVRLMYEGVAQRVTIEQLLSNRSGLAEDNAWGDRRLGDTRESVLELAAQGLRLTAEPGEMYQYSNLGMSLVGRAIEAVTGSSVEQVIRERVIDPLGLQHTRFSADDYPSGTPLAKGYRTFDESKHLHEEPYVGNGALACIGGLFSTVDDIATWAGFVSSAYTDAPLRPELMEPASRREMQRIHTAAVQSAHQQQRGLDAVGYGLGLFVEHDLRFGRIAQHTGGLPGFTSHMRWHTASGVGVVTFANCDVFRAEPFAASLHTEVLAAKGIEAPTPQTPRPFASWPETLASARRIDEALRSGVSAWSLDGVFAVNAMHDVPPEVRQQRLAEALEETGPVNPQQAPLEQRIAATLGPAEVRWRIECERGALLCDARLVGLSTPLVQTLIVAVAEEG
ncbi:amidohydrolase family protein [Leucobacter sp. UCMA 4100]|uniref:amidohydrolase family protein n=1 Tax=Leucobacter sp. UCMA 4100 TaxID=2810534 RepID=UPI0022EAC4D6|nr:amidohydrolase family protein [Leucobacter sp. UCMA 4100]MDA3146667.1 amidohydrolase family protein [Leucobacter sp. UCMA 4100]